MYRIIGVFPDESGEQHLKLIKYKQLGSYKWHSNDWPGVSWEESDLYKGLNGISGGSYSDLFIGNTTYDYLQENNSWYEKIADWKWTATNTLTHYSGSNYGSLTTKQIYLHEMNRSTKTNTKGEWTYPIAKIGLMYASDYMMSLGSNSLTMTSDNKAILKTGWLQPSNNDITASTSEWLMTRVGDYGDTFLAWSVYDGVIEVVLYDNAVNNDNGVVPVFYLDSTVTTSGGTGEYSNPYLIQE